MCLGPLHARPRKQGIGCIRSAFLEKTCQSDYAGKQRQHRPLPEQASRQKQHSRSRKESRCKSWIANDHPHGLAARKRGRFVCRRVNPLSDDQTSRGHLLTDRGHLQSKFPGRGSAHSRGFRIARSASISARVAENAALPCAEVVAALCHASPKATA